MVCARLSISIYHELLLVQPSTTAASTFEVLLSDAIPDTVDPYVAGVADLEMMRDEELRMKDKIRSR